MRTSLLLASSLLCVLQAGCSSDEAATSTTSSAAATGSTGAGVGGAGGAGTGGGGGGGGAAPSCALGGSWTLVDDYVPSATDEAGASGITWSSTGDLLVVGGTLGGDPTTNRWLVRRSKDGGETWAIVDDFQPMPGVPANGLGIATAPNGDLYAAGSAGPAGSAHGLVRKSVDGGDTWVTYDDFVYNPGFDVFPGPTAIDAMGVIYVVAQAGSAVGPHVVVRKSADTGETWSTAFDFQLVPGKLAVPRGVAIDADRNVFVTSRALDASDTPHWIVARGSADGTWTTVDDFDGGPTAMDVNVGGVSVGSRVFVAGAAPDVDGTSRHWILRSAAAPGEAWSTLADSKTADEGASFVHEDGSGALTVLGSRTLVNDPVPYHSTTQRSTDGGETFQPIDDYGYEAGVFLARAVPDAAGALYANGIGLGADGRKHWLLRRMACQ